ncbi:hypothetical protein QL285_020326 [Trifolium repens]|nr:hypothetical protein QL285_020326 [Trifolium repens]
MTLQVLVHSNFSLGSALGLNMNSSTSGPISSEFLSTRPPRSIFRASQILHTLMEILNPATNDSISVVVNGFKPICSGVLP